MKGKHCTRYMWNLNIEPQKQRTEQWLSLPRARLKGKTLSEEQTSVRDDEQLQETYHMAHILPML